MKRKCTVIAAVCFLVLCGALLTVFLSDEFNLNYGGRDNIYPEKTHQNIPEGIMSGGGEYDTAKLEKIIEEIETGYTGEITDPEAEAKLNAAVADMKGEMEKFFTANVILEARYDSDIGREDLSERLNAQKESYSELYDRCIMCLAKVLKGSLRDVVVKDMTEDDIKNIENYTPDTEKQQELASREDALIQEYDKVAARDDNITEINRDAAEIYRKLVSTRMSLAEEYGVSDYCDYVDKEEYNRDYGSSELEKFRDEVKIYCTYVSVQA